MVPVIAPNTISEYLRLFSKCKQRCNFKDDAILINSFGIQIEVFSSIDFGEHGFLNNDNIIENMIINHTYNFIILAPIVYLVILFAIASGNSFLSLSSIFTQNIH